jgi:hypothetical protein
MKKIQNLKINGIRGFAFKQDAPQIIELGEKHLFIFGENGSGKSSTFESLEWYFTGKSEEATNRKVNNKSIYLKNRNCRDEEIPFVEIQLNSDNSYQRRELQSRGKCPVYNLDFEPHFIEVKRIEDFVINTKTELYDRFINLIGLNDLYDLEKQLGILKTHAEKEHQTANNKLSEKKQELNTKTNEITKLTEKGLPDSNNSDINQLTEEKRDLELLKKTLSEIKPLEDSIKQTQTSLETNNEKINAQKGSLEDADLLDVITNTVKFLTTNKESSSQQNATCPVCKSIPKIDLLTDLTNRQNALGQLITLKKENTRLTTEQQQNERNLREKKKTIDQLCTNLKITDISDPDISNTLDLKIQKITQLVNSNKDKSLFENLQSTRTKLEQEAQDLEKSTSTKKKILDDLTSYIVMLIRFRRQTF